MSDWPTVCVFRPELAEYQAYVGRSPTSSPKLHLVLAPRVTPMILRDESSTSLGLVGESSVLRQQQEDRRTPAQVVRHGLALLVVSSRTPLPLGWLLDQSGTDRIEVHVVWFLSQNPHDNLPGARVVQERCRR